MKIEVGQIWRARNGSLWRIVCVDAKGDKPVVAVGDEPDKDGDYMPADSYTGNGRHVADDEESIWDLIAQHREPMKRTGWLITLADGDEFMALKEDDLTLQYAVKEGLVIHRGTWTEETP